MRMKKQSIDQERQKKEELRSLLERQGLKLKSLEKDLQTALSSKKKWELERSQFLESQKARGEQFGPFIEILQEITKHSGIKMKIKRLYTKILRPKGVERIFIYSLKAQQKLRLEGGYWEDHEIPPLKKNPLSLQKSVFGQAVTSLKMQSFQKNERLTDMELPLELKALVMKEVKAELDTEKILPSVLVIPLVIGTQVIGILSLASKDMQSLGNEGRQLLSDLSPLLALSLEQEQKLNEEAELKKYRQSLRESNKYLQERYAKMSDHAYQLSQRMEKGLPESIKTDFIPHLKLPQGLLPSLGAIKGMGKRGSANTKSGTLGASSKEARAEGFIKWIDVLGDKAEKSLGLEFHKEIKFESLCKLNEKIGTTFSNLYWLCSEAVENVIAHSHASKMSISFQAEKARFSLRIIDNGDGLRRTAGRREARSGRGLQAIQHLAIVSGAQGVDFESDEKGHGLSVIVNWDSDSLLEFR